VTLEKSTAWDAFSVLVASAGAIASAGSVATLIVNMMGRRMGASVFGLFIPSGIGVVAFLPLMLFYAQTVRFSVTVTEHSICGLAGNRTIALSDVAAWDIRETLLIVWPSGQYRRSREVMARIHPRVPKGTLWAVLDQSKCSGMRVLLAARVGPPRTDPGPLQ